MTVTKTFNSGGITITIKTPKDIEVTEISPSDNSIIIMVEDRLLMALRRPKKLFVAPG